MFSQFVTAAKGLFTRPESEEASTDPTDTSTPTASRMVTATRQRVVQPEQSTEEPVSNGVAKGGKRKAQVTSTEKPEQKQSKRRKRDSLEGPEQTNHDSTAGTLEQTSKEGKEKNHFRFGSEEPEQSVPQIPVETSNQDVQGDSDSDSDSDDAPETIDNSAQLLKMKEHAKRQEKNKQL